MKTKSDIFFIRSDNDLDHIVPLIHILSDDENCRNIFIFGRNPIKTHKDDKRILFLLKKSKVKYLDIIDLSGSTFQIFIKFFRILYWGLIKISNINKFPKFNKIFNFLIYITRSSLFNLNNSFEQKININLIFNKVGELNEINSFTCDYHFDFIVAEILKSCKKNNIKTFAVPHSINHLSGTFSGEKFDLTFNNPVRSMGYLNNFDQVLAVNKIMLDRFISLGIPKDKIIVIGAVRFSKYWIKYLRSIYKTDFEHFSKYIKKDKISILLTLSKNIGHVNYQEVKRIIRAINYDDKYQLFIKPHSRLSSQSFSKDLISNSFIINDNTPSFVVSDNVDVTIFWGTSFIYDPLVNNKKILQIKYVFALECDFNKWFNEIEISSRDDLAKALELISNKKDLLSVQNRSKCIDFLVNGSVSNQKQKIIKIYV